MTEIGCGETVGYRMVRGTVSGCAWSASGRRDVQLNGFVSFELSRTACPVLS